MNKLENIAPVAPHEVAEPEFAPTEGIWASFIAAVQFLTRLPIKTRTPVTADALQRSPMFFPLVGGLIGIFTATAIGAGSLIWPIWLAVPIALALEMLLTGALHEDGIADFCDAFGGGWSRDDVLRILKDSRIGAYGALGLFMALSLRAAATIEIVSHYATANPLLWASVLVAGSAIGRWIMVLAMYCAPPIPRRDSLARDIARQLKGRYLLIATFVGMPFAAGFVYFHPLHSLAAVILIAPIVWGLLWQVKRRIGGVTGDCLGCIGYVAHVLVLLAAAMRWSNLS